MVPSLLLSRVTKQYNKNTKECYTLLVSTKAQLPNHAANLKRDLNFSENQLRQVYSLPHTVTFEPYLRVFQYKVSNAILYTNAKLFKIGFLEDDKCTFCKQEVETIYHPMFHCFYLKHFSEAVWILLLFNNKSSGPLKSQRCVVWNYQFKMHLAELLVNHRKIVPLGLQKKQSSP